MKSIKSTGYKQLQMCGRRTDTQGRELGEDKGSDTELRCNCFQGHVLELVCISVHTHLPPPTAFTMPHILPPNQSMITNILLKMITLIILVDYKPFSSI